MVSTSRCGRDNPGSNPGHGIAAVQCRCYGIVGKFFDEYEKKASIYLVSELIKYRFNDMSK